MSWSDEVAVCTSSHVITDVDERADDKDSWSRISDSSVASGV